MQIVQRKMSLHVFLYASVWGGIFGTKYNDHVMLYQEVLHLMPVAEWQIQNLVLSYC